MSDGLVDGEEAPSGDWAPVAPQVVNSSYAKLMASINRLRLVIKLNGSQRIASTDGWQHWQQ